VGVRIHPPTHTSVCVYVPVFAYTPTNRSIAYMVGAGITYTCICIYTHTHPHPTSHSPTPFTPPCCQPPSHTCACVKVRVYACTPTNLSMAYTVRVSIYCRLLFRHIKPCDLLHFMSYGTGKQACVCMYAWERL